MCIRGRSRAQCGRLRNMLPGRTGREASDQDSDYQWPARCVRPQARRMSEPRPPYRREQGAMRIRAALDERLSSSTSRQPRLEKWSAVASAPRWYSPGRSAAAVRALCPSIRGVFPVRAKAASAQCRLARREPARRFRTACLPGRRAGRPRVAHWGGGRVRDRARSAAAGPWDRL
jgi:hypothetical protein